MPNPEQKMEKGISKEDHIRKNIHIISSLLEGEKAKLTKMRSQLTDRSFELAKMKLQLNDTAFASVKCICK
jgi:hypothetical protein